MRIAVLGAGRIGKIHGLNVASRPGVKLVAVADPNRPSAEALASATGAEVRDVDSVIECADVDAVIIGAPTTTHADFIERAARAGKAIFCEKPVDLSSARIQACLDVVKTCGVPLMIGFTAVLIRASPSWNGVCAPAPSARSRSSPSSRAIPIHRRPAT